MLKKIKNINIQVEVFLGRPTFFEAVVLPVDFRVLVV